MMLKEASNLTAIKTMQTETQTISIENTVKAPAKEVWKLWTTPEHITKWNAASDDWHTTSAKTDLKAGGKFTSRMEAKDGSFGFDFGGIYEEVRENEYLASKLDDGRKMSVTFAPQGNKTKVIETFETENTNPVDLQRTGWQAILDNFKKYAESLQD
jgi:uncharacterized protein YndB with AHSA1/START domain